MKTIHRNCRTVSVGLLALALAGCAGLDVPRSRRCTSSVVDYLFADKLVNVEPTVPRLALPLRVGMAFVPETEGKQDSWRPPPPRALNERERMDLMDRVGAEFKALPFVKSIEPIPSAYLVSRGGFTNLDQIQQMHGIDVIVLLSYDQVQHTDDSMFVLTYLTIVGSVVVQGEKNDTSTMVDAAVFDIASRKLLFRAPGTSQVRAHSTPLHLEEELRGDSLTGFHLATDNLVVNLKDQLERFQERVKEAPEEYTIEHRPGYTGGSSLGAIYALAMLAMGGLALWRGRRR